MKTAIFIEKNPVSGKLRDVSFELIAKASSLMSDQKGEVTGLFCGDSLPSNIDDLFSFGLNKLLYFEDPSLSNIQPFAFKNILKSMIVKEDPDIVLFGATSSGREIAPLIASSLMTGLTADCTQLSIDDYKDKGKILYQVRPAFGGNILATIISPDHKPVMSTVREGVMRLPEKRVVNRINKEIFSAEMNSSWITNTIIETVLKKRNVHLDRSGIIVAGGAGIGSRENFELLFGLADVLGAEVGGSRAAVDAGYIEKERQIGQTGVVVRPKLYLAFGISGSIQHRAGMEESGKIIAVNTDINAPIFDISHFGIVDDFKSVIPMMMRYLKEDIDG